MLNIKKTKRALTRKLIPFFLKRLIGFLNIYTKITRNGLEKKDLISFGDLSKYVLEHYYRTFKNGAIWTTLFVPSEIVFAMKLHPFSIEVAAAISAKFGKSSYALSEADLAAIPTDTCSFHRAALGLASAGLYPSPMLLVGTSTICDSNTKTIKICESITGKKSIIIDVPYDLNDDSVKYLKDQLINLTKCLEEISGKKMEKDSLAEAIWLSNKAREKMIEINRIRQDPLSPLTGCDALGLMMPSHLLIGSKYAADFYTKLLEEIKEKITLARKNEAKKEDKTIKLLWLELKPYFKADIFDKIENAGKTKIVFEEINYVYWEKLDPDKPYESLARKLISNHNNGPLEKRLEVIKMLARNYNADGVVAFSTWGCRRNNAAIPIIKEELNKEGFPFLNLDGDCIDDSNYMPGQIATRAEGFIEMLGARKQTKN